MKTDQELGELLTPTESARFMNMSLNQFKHHLTRPGAPQPVLVGRFRHQFYRESQLKTWKPRRLREQQPTNKEE